MKTTVISVLMAGGALLAGCVETPIVNTIDGACETGTFVGAFDGEVIVPQNWTCQDRQEFWFTNQGSQILPYSWFLHLERDDSNARFSDPANLDRYRYLPQKPTRMNPDGLPIGFTKGNAKNNAAYGKMSRDWLGVTCAACHTGQVEFEGRKVLIDGAPTMADFESLFVDLARALKVTAGDDRKFERFARLVIADSKLRGDGGTDDPAVLRAQLTRMASIRDEWNRRNQGTPASGPYGHARLDAIGAIFNEVAATALGVPGNVRPADAPVSYPFIWDTPQHDKVQWNGSVANAGAGSLGRNVGEVLGVFGTLKIRGRRLVPIGHETSVNVEGLARLEELVWKLQSPLWREAGLPEIDSEKAARGKVDFDRFCAGCHQPIDRADPTRRVEAVMIPIRDPKAPNDPNALNTDPTMATNFIEPRQRRNGRALTGRYKRYLRPLSDGKKFRKAERDATSAASMLGFSVTGAIVNLLVSDPRETIRALKVGQPPESSASVDRANRHLDGDVSPDEAATFLREVSGDTPPAFALPSGAKCVPDGALACYKARPLNGIWATAPYLHNGSVRTMRELLLPGAMRQKTFRVGSRRFDPVEIGFVDDGASVLDTARPGNANTGHDGPIYGNQELADNPERMEALLEYLKTL